MTQHTSQHQYIFYVVTKHTDRINLSCIGFWFELRQSVSDPKWWENLSPVTCNRFVTPCVALPLHLSSDLRRFPPNSGALEAVKLLHTSAAVHSHNLPIISLPAMIVKIKPKFLIWLYCLREMTVFLWLEIFSSF